VSENQTGVPADGATAPSYREVLDDMSPKVRVAVSVVGVLTAVGGVVTLMVTGKAFRGPWPGPPRPSSLTGK